MGSSNIRDVLTSFSPALDYLAISTGDGRIKIWDTVKGQLQTEFADITSSEQPNFYTKTERGHLSVDYTCMKWLSVEKKKKRKLGSSLLVLGTGGGDVLALDVAAGQLKWRISDCHPGGVSSVAFSSKASCIYSGGADGMISEIEPHGGNILRNFRASSKAISCLSVTSDGEILATAAAQLKIFRCSDHRKIQKFSGHPGAVRFMVFTEDGNYILSSAIGERYVAMWRTDGGKKQSACCVLAMEHPAVYIDCQHIDNDKDDEGGLHVLALSETGVCYYWYGQDIEGLRNAGPAKVSVSVEDSLSKGHRGTLPVIFAAKLQSIAKPGAVHAFIASGLFVNPSFQKILLQSGTDLVLNSSRDGVLLRIAQSGVSKSKKGQDVPNKVTTLDRAYAEDALLPIPKVANLHEERSRQQILGLHSDMVHCETSTSLADDGDYPIEMEADETFCMEDRLRSLGILGSEEEFTSKSLLTSSVLKGIDLEANTPDKKIRSDVLSMSPSDAQKTLAALVALWQTRLYKGKYLLPWINSILIHHGRHIMSSEMMNQQMLNSLLKITKSRQLAVQKLLHLSGRLQLVSWQIEKAKSGTQTLADEPMIDGSEDEDEVDDVHYGDEDSESALSSDDEN